MPSAAFQRDTAFHGLRPFPSKPIPQNAISSKDAWLQELQNQALVSIWSELSSAIDAATDVGGFNAEAFEEITAFCHDAPETAQDGLPVGALFAGSLIPCQAVEPLKLLAEVLHESGFEVLTVDHLQHNKAAHWITAVRERPRRGPLVVLIESADRMPKPLLFDLLSLLTRHYVELKATLLMGVCSAARLDAIFPVEFRSQIDCQAFPLACPRVCLETLIEKALLSPSCPAVVLGHAVMELLNNVYLYHHFTIQSFKDNLKQALLDHIHHSPDGCLLPCMGRSCVNQASMRAALEALPDELWTEMQPAEVEKLPEVMQSGLECVTGWKTCVLYLHLIAEAVGFVRRGAGYSLRELYISALYPDFLQTHPIPKVWLQLQTSFPSASVD